MKDFLNDTSNFTTFETFMRIHKIYFPSESTMNTDAKLYNRIQLFLCANQLANVSTLRCRKLNRYNSIARNLA